jgi:hypothetical protein
LDILSRLGTVKEVNIKLGNNREVYRPVNHKPRGHALRSDNLPEYYILAGEGKSRELQGRTVYFAKLTRGGFRYLPYPNVSAVKVFRTERDASRYAEKYAARLNHFAAFRPALVTKESGLS